VARRIALARIRGVEGHERCEGRDRHLAKVARGDVRPGLSLVAVFITATKHLPYVSETWRYRGNGKTRFAKNDLLNPFFKEKNKNKVGPNFMSEFY